MSTEKIETNSGTSESSSSSSEDFSNQLVKPSETPMKPGGSKVVNDSSSASTSSLADDENPFSLSPLEEVVVNATPEEVVPDEITPEPKPEPVEENKTTSLSSSVQNDFSKPGDYKKDGLISSSSSKTEEDKTGSSSTSEEERKPEPVKKTSSSSSSSSSEEVVPDEITPEPKPEPVKNIFSSSSSSKTEKGNTGSSSTSEEERKPEPVKKTSSSSSSSPSSSSSVKDKKSDLLNSSTSEEEKPKKKKSKSKRTAPTSSSSSSSSSLSSSEDADENRFMRLSIEDLVWVSLKNAETSLFNDAVQAKLGEIDCYADLLKFFEGVEQEGFEPRSLYQRNTFKSESKKALLQKVINLYADDLDFDEKLNMLRIFAYVNTLDKREMLFNPKQLTKLMTVVNSMLADFSLEREPCSAELLFEVAEAYRVVLPALNEHGCLKIYAIQAIYSFAKDFPKQTYKLTKELINIYMALLEEGFTQENLKFEKEALMDSFKKLASHLVHEPEDFFSLGYLKGLKEVFHAKGVGFGSAIEDLVFAYFQDGIAKRNLNIYTENQADFVYFMQLFVDALFSQKDQNEWTTVNENLNAMIQRGIRAFYAEINENEVLDSPSVSELSQLSSSSTSSSSEGLEPSNSVEGIINGQADVGAKFFGAVGQLGGKVAQLGDYVKGAFVGAEAHPYSSSLLKVLKANTNYEEKLFQYLEGLIFFENEGGLEKHKLGLELLVRLLNGHSSEVRAFCKGLLKTDRAEAEKNKKELGKLVSWMNTKGASCVSAFSGDDIESLISFYVSSTEKKAILSDDTKEKRGAFGTEEDREGFIYSVIEAGENNRNSRNVDLLNNGVNRVKRKIHGRTVNFYDGVNPVERTIDEHTVDFYEGEKLLEKLTFSLETLRSAINSSRRNTAKDDRNLEDAKDKEAIQSIINKQKDSSLVSMTELFSRYSQAIRKIGFNNLPEADKETVFKFIFGLLFEDSPVGKTLVNAFSEIKDLPLNAENLQKSNAFFQTALELFSPLLDLGNRFDFSRILKEQDVLALLNILEKANQIASLNINGQKDRLKSVKRTFFCFFAHAMTRTPESTALFDLVISHFDFNQKQLMIGYFLNTPVENLDLSEKTLVLYIASKCSDAEFFNLLTDLIAGKDKEVNDKLYRELYKVFPANRLLQLIKSVEDETLVATQLNDKLRNEVEMQLKLSSETDVAKNLASKLQSSAEIYFQKKPNNLLNVLEEMVLMKEMGVFPEEIEMVFENYATQINSGNPSYTDEDLAMVAVFLDHPASKRLLEIVKGTKSPVLHAMKQENARELVAKVQEVLPLLSEGAASDYAKFLLGKSKVFESVLNAGRTKVFGVTRLDSKYKQDRSAEIKPYTDEKSNNDNHSVLLKVQAWAIEFSGLESVGAGFLENYAKPDAAMFKPTTYSVFYRNALRDGLISFSEFIKMAEEASNGDKQHKVMLYLVLLGFNETSDYALDCLKTFVDIKDITADLLGELFKEYFLAYPQEGRHKYFKFTFGVFNDDHDAVAGGVLSPEYLGDSYNLIKDYVLKQAEKCDPVKGLPYGSPKLLEQKPAEKKPNNGANVNSFLKYTVDLPLYGDDTLNANANDNDSDKNNYKDAAEKNKEFLSLFAYPLDKMYRNLRTIFRSKEYKFEDFGWGYQGIAGKGDLEDIYIPQLLRLITGLLLEAKAGGLVSSEELATFINENVLGKLPTEKLCTSVNEFGEHVLSNVVDGYVITSEQLSRFDKLVKTSQDEDSPYLAYLSSVDFEKIREDLKSFNGIASITPAAMNQIALYLRSIKQDKLLQELRLRREFDFTVVRDGFTSIVANIEHLQSKDNLGNTPLYYWMHSSNLRELDISLIKDMNPLFNIGQGYTVLSLVLLHAICANDFDVLRKMEEEMPMSIQELNQVNPRVFDSLFSSGLLANLPSDYLQEVSNIFSDFARLSVKYSGMKHEFDVVKEDIFHFEERFECLNNAVPVIQDVSFKAQEGLNNAKDEFIKRRQFKEDQIAELENFKNLLDKAAKRSKADKRPSKRLEKKINQFIEDKFEGNMEFRSRRKIRSLIKTLENDRGSLRNEVKAISSFFKELENQSMTLNFLLQLGLVDGASQEALSDLGFVDFNLSLQGVLNERGNVLASLQSLQLEQTKLAEHIECDFSEGQPLFAGLLSDYLLLQEDVPSEHASNSQSFFSGNSASGSSLSSEEEEQSQSEKQSEDQSKTRSSVTSSSSL